MRFKLSTICLAVLVFCSWGTTSTAADDPKQSCGAIAALLDDDDLDGALEEAHWCVEALEQLKQNSVTKHFLEDIDGWRRVDLEENKAMGISVTEATYEKDNVRITVSLTGGAGGSGMGGFGAIAQMGMMQQGGKKIRIQRRTAIVVNDMDPGEIVITLKGGGMLQLESSDIDAEGVIKFAEMFPVAEIDDALGT